MRQIPTTTLEKFTTFGDLLRFLRRRVAMTQMDLALEVGYSDAQISRLEQNLRLPDIPTIQARFVDALGLQDEPQAFARLLELAATVRREDAPAAGLCPYKGMQFFDEADADSFVGREALSALLTRRVIDLLSDKESPHGRFLAVVGASGSGKSSLVRAGLVPMLRWEKTSADWEIHVLTPTAHPLENLAGVLTSESHSVTATAVLLDELEADARSLHLFARRKMGTGSNARILLVIDQFEELFTLCRSEHDRERFVGNLLSASAEPDGPVIVVIALRADFYAHCAAYERLREALASRQQYIGAMNSDEMRRMIEESAQRSRWELEPGLVDLLLRDVGGEPGALHLLSHALLETWRRRRGRMMTLSGYASSQGVRGAIAETAETVFTDQFTREQQVIARRIFLRLTELGDESNAVDTRRRATYEELILKSEEAEDTLAVLNALADARLITASETSVEVAHEALIREWPTLRGWLDENRDELRVHRQLTEASQMWHVSGQQTDLLYRGLRLDQAQAWAAAHPFEMNSLERAFLEESQLWVDRDSAEREAQRLRELDSAKKLAETEHRTTKQLRRSARFLAGGLMLTLLAAIMAGYFANRNSALAIQNAAIAETAQAARKPCQTSTVLRPSDWQQKRKA